MANEIYGFKVDGVTYEYDYEHLANNPIPEAGASDNGKVLTAGANGTLVWAAVPSGSSLPDSSASDKGKTLVVQSNGAAAWRNLLPTSSADDSGKVLKSGGCGMPYYWDDPISTSGASDGNVLIYAGGSGPQWGSVLPDYSGSDVAFLSIGGCGQCSWESIPSIPECSMDDAGKVLMVGECGVPEWADLQ